MTFFLTKDIAVLLSLNQVLTRVYVDNLRWTFLYLSMGFHAYLGLCYLYMQEHIISNFAAHTTAGHLFTDNVTTFVKNIFRTAEGKMISHMRRIHPWRAYAVIQWASCLIIDSNLHLQFVILCKCIQSMEVDVKAQSGQSLRCLYTRSMDVGEISLFA